MGLFDKLHPRGKIVTEEEMEFTKIKLDPSVVEINDKIAALIRATLLTQEEFDTLSWLELAERFDQDVTRLDEALAILDATKAAGITGLDYIDVDAIVNLRMAKKSQAAQCREYHRLNINI